MTKNITPKSRRTRILKVLLAAACLLVFCVAAVAASIWPYGAESSTESADAALVLGGGPTTAEGPNPIVRERINHGVALYHAGRVQKLILTGGPGKTDGIVASEAARTYAIARGVPDDAILIERESRTTNENLQFAKEVATEHKLTSFLVVSDPMHMKRAIAMAHRLGLSAEPSPTPTTTYTKLPDKLRFLWRETYLYIGNALRSNI